MSRTRVNYRKIWEEHNKACILPGMHIHHVDGNSHNNNPDNLLLCSPQEHWNIHASQGDIRCLNGKFVQGASEAGKLGGAAGKGWKYTKEQSERLSNALKESYIRRGGSPLKGTTIPDERKAKISKSVKGELNGMYGKNHTEDTKAKISEKRKGFASREAGWKHDDETRKIISEKRKEYFDNGGLNPNAKFYNIYDINDNLLFTNVSSNDIMEHLDIDMRTYKTIMTYMRRNNYSKVHPKYGVRINVL